MNPESKRRPLCRCCDQNRAFSPILISAQSCSDCYATLTAIRVMLEKIGPLVGIGACSSEINH